MRSVAASPSTDSGADGRPLPLVGARPASLLRWSTGGWAGCLQSWCAFCWSLGAYLEDLRIEARRCDAKAMTFPSNFHVQGIVARCSVDWSDARFGVCGLKAGWIERLTPLGKDLTELSEIDAGPFFC